MLELGLLAQGRRTIGLHLLPQALELGGELLELVPSAQAGADVELAAPQAVQLAPQGAQRSQSELGQSHGREPGQGQRDDGEGETPPDRGVELFSQQGGGDAEVDGREGLSIEVHGQHRLVGLAAPVERGESPDGAEAQQLVQAARLERGSALAVTPRIQEGGPAAVGDEGVHEMRRVPHAGLEQVAKLAVPAQSLERRAAGGAREDLPDLRVNLLGHELSLSRGFLDDHPGELGDVHHGGGGNHEEREQCHRDGVLAANAESHARRRKTSACYGGSSS